METTSKPAEASKTNTNILHKDHKKVFKKYYKAYGFVRFATLDSPEQKLVQYAYSLGGREFTLTLDGENLGLWFRDQKSLRVGSNGYSDYGLCQLNAEFHDGFIFKNKQNLKDGFSDAFKNPYQQLDYCFEVWKDGEAKKRLPTTFYAYNNRHNKAFRFIGL